MCDLMVIGIGLIVEKVEVVVDKGSYDVVASVGYGRTVRDAGRGSVGRRNLTAVRAT